MRQLRLGAYSTAATLAATPSLVRLKSTMRYCCLWPPPLWRAVLRPWTLRPPVLGFGTTRLRSGSVFVISLKSETVWNRRPALVGLRLRSAMVSSSAFEQLDVIVRVERDDGPLGVGPLAHAEGAPVALALALAVERVHLHDAHAEDRLDGVVDLGLGRVRVHAERVDVLLEQRVGLLRHDRLDDDVTGIPHESLAPLAMATGVEPSDSSSPAVTLVGRVAFVKTTQSLTSTS